MSALTLALPSEGIARLVSTQLLEAVRGLMLPLLAADRTFHPGRVRLGMNAHREHGETYWADHIVVSLLQRQPFALSLACVACDAQIQGRVFARYRCLQPVTLHYDWLESYDDYTETMGHCEPTWHERPNRYPFQLVMGGLEAEIVLQQVFDSIASTWRLRVLRATLKVDQVTARVPARSVMASSESMFGAELEAYFHMVIERAHGAHTLAWLLAQGAPASRMESLESLATS